MHILGVELGQKMRPTNELAENRAVSSPTEK